MSFSFIHLADIHLGRPFSCLSEFSCSEMDLSVYKNAVEKSLEKVFDFAVNKKVDFVLISGDTFDNTEFDISSKFIFKNFLKRLEKEKIQVFVVCGNHDPVSSYNKNTFNFDKASIVNIIGLNTPLKTKLPFYDKSNELRCYIYSISFDEEKFKGNLLEDFDDVNPSYFNIALLHCDVEGTQDSPYAPCALSELKSFNFDYCALGHIHTPKELSENIYYSGTLQGRNIKEKGEHGIRYICVENNKIASNSFIPMDVVRYDDLEVDLSDVDDDTQALELILDKINHLINFQQNLCEVYLISLKLYGSVSFYSSLNKNFNKTLLESIQDISAAEIHFSKIENLTTPKIDNEVLKNDDGISGELYKLLNSNEEIETLYSKIFNDIEKVCIGNLDKEQIINLIKQEGKNICHNMYSDINEG